MTQNIDAELTALSEAIHAIDITDPEAIMESMELIQRWHDTLKACAEDEWPAARLAQCEATVVRLNQLLTKVVSILSEKVEWRQQRLDEAKLIPRRGPNLRKTIALLEAEIAHLQYVIAVCMEQLDRDQQFIASRPPRQPRSIRGDVALREYIRSKQVH